MILPRYFKVTTKHKDFVSFHIENINGTKLLHYRVFHTSYHMKSDGLYLMDRLIDDITTEFYIHWSCGSGKRGEKEHYPFVLHEIETMFDKMFYEMRNEDAQYLKYIKQLK